LGKEFQIETILEEVEFDKIRSVMIYLNWTWGLNREQPSIDKLKNVAKKLLESVWDMPEDNESSMCWTGTGGFVAYKQYFDGLKMLSLKFELTGWEFEYDDVQNENYS
jgi:hypothetical protein